MNAGSWIIFTAFIFGAVLMAYYMGKNTGYEYGYEDGKDVGYAEGSINRRHTHNRIIRGESTTD